MPWLPDLLCSFLIPLGGWLASLPLRRWALAREVVLEAELAWSGGLLVMLASVQFLGMVLGFLGLLRASLILPILVLGIVAALVAGGGNLRSSFKGVTALLPTLLLLLPLLLLATFPPWDRDEMVYHLALPRSFALAGKYTRPDDNIFASLPLGWESIQAVLHAVGPVPGEPPFNPRLLGAWTAWGGALATEALAREAGAQRLPWLAGVLLLLTPTFVEFGSSAYVEPYLLLCTALALLAMLRAAKGSEGWLLLAAALAGLTTSIKYTGLAVAAILAIEVATTSPPEERLRRLLRFVALCALVGSPFYVRNLLQRGNPFFPIAYGLFGGEGWDEVRATAYWETLRGYGAGEDLLDAWTAPLRLFFARNHLTGFEGSIGPIPLLLALGAVLWPAPEGRHTSRVLLTFPAIFALFWAATVVQARFFLVALPSLLAIGVAWLEARGPRLVPLPLLGSLLWGAPLALFLWRRQPTTEWLCGRLSRDQALARVLPQSYVPSRELSSLVPPGERVWLLWMRGYTYYVQVPYKMDCVYEEWRFADLLDRSKDGAHFAQKLRAEKVSFLLVNEHFFLRGGSSDTRPGRTAELRMRFERMLREGMLKEIRRWDRVVLYRLSEEEPIP
ncbi:MAG: glycosyltransferase family 39 protein [Myxococcales bacterium]|nr:glycosyltransferase family 39 protein [Polyangiaceae bacterium]MDW8250718.1 glycosyltransferase family 39 protein [Myxococcales bacterium]